MINSTEYHNPAAYNYAEAMMRLVRGGEPAGARLEQVSEQAKVLLEVLRQDGEKLSRFMIGPQIPTQAKLEMIGRIFGEQFDPMLTNLMRMLVKRDRSLLLRDILETFIEMAAQARGLRVGKVTTAVNLSPDGRQMLKTALEKYTKQNLSLEFITDPKLIGGVVFHSGDELIDYSVRGRLETLRKKLQGAAI